MPQNYTPEFLKRRLSASVWRKEEPVSSITIGYGISKKTTRWWCNESQKECQAQSLQIPPSSNEPEIMKDSLRRELAEKEILFLKISICHHRWHCILRKGDQ